MDEYDLSELSGFILTCLESPCQVSGGGERVVVPDHQKRRKWLGPRKSSAFRSGGFKDY